MISLSNNSAVYFRRVGRLGMGKLIVLIGCAKKKCLFKSVAEEVYISPLFQLSLKYAHKLKPDAIFILSAKYGLITLRDEIKPYDTTLNKMTAVQRKAWSLKIIEQLEIDFDLQKDHFIILAGKRYRQFLLSYIASFEIPLHGLPIGKQMQFLKREVEDG